jgi:hypothetical protein
VKIRSRVEAIYKIAVFIIYLGMWTGCGPISVFSKSFEANAAQAPSAVSMALKFVEFSDESTSPPLSNSQVKQLIQKLNQLYSQCDITFQLGEYQIVKPADYGLPMGPTSVKKMHEFRKPFDDPRYLVIINTGKWNHQKVGTPNAWTAMPGEVPAGAVLEAPVSNFPGIVAHEIGHYLNLNHMENNKNLMNPIIYGDSKELTEDQCSQMRATAVTHRPAAMRQYDGGSPTVSFKAAYSG